MTVRWYGEEAKRRMHSAAEKALAEGAEFLLEEANRTAPIEEGTLIRSGHVSQDGLVARVGYNTPYAARQHEDLTLRHDSGRRGKWLQLTFSEQRSRFAAFIASKIKGRF